MSHILLLVSLFFRMQIFNLMDDGRSMNGDSWKFGVLVEIIDVSFNFFFYQVIVPLFYMLMNE